MCVGILFPYNLTGSNSVGKVHVPSQSDSVALLLKKVSENNTPYIMRYKAACSLTGKRLSKHHIEKIYRFLTVAVDKTNLKEIELNAVKNMLVEALLACDPPVPDLPDKLISMYNDKSLDTMWRDYCIQFLGTLYGRIKKPDVKRRIRRTLKDALSETSVSIAGTALLAMWRYIDTDSRNHSITAQKRFNVPNDNTFPFSVAYLAEKSFEMLESGDTCEAVKVTAVQICASCCHPYIRDWLLNELDKPAVTINYRVALFAALGICGSDKDIEILGKYENSPDIRLRTASRAAISKIKHKASHGEHGVSRR